MDGWMDGWMDYVVHLTCVIPIQYPVKRLRSVTVWRQTKQSNSKNHKCRHLLRINLAHKNVLQMSTVSPDTIRERDATD